MTRTLIKLYALSGGVLLSTMLSCSRNEPIREVDPKENTTPSKPNTEPISKPSTPSTSSTDNSSENTTIPTQVEIYKQIRAAADLVATRKSYIMSPNTRDNIIFNFDEKAITYDKTKEIATVDLSVSWEARKYLLDWNTYKASITGKLYVTFSLRPNTYTFTFIPATCNDFASWLGKDKALAKLSGTIN